MRPLPTEVSLRTEDDGMGSSTETCLTCYGRGEQVTESGPEPCPDCFQDGSLSRSTRFEWRLREIEHVYRSSGRETEADVLWLVHELRQSRAALLRILARCQDADDSDATARDLKFLANDALGLYAPEDEADARSTAVRRGPATGTRAVEGKG